MSIFTTQHPTQAVVAEVVKQLAAAEASVIRLQASLQTVALQSAVSGDFTEAERIGASIREGKARIEVLRRAHDGAIGAERDRLAAARLRADQTSLKAFRAHAGRINSAARDFEAAVALEQLAWGKLLDAAQSARNLLPANRDEYVALFEGSLSSEAEIERARVGRRDPMTGSTEVSLPGTRGTGGGDYYKAQPLAERIAAQLASCSDQFARSLSLPAPPAPAAAIADPHTPPGAGQGADLPGTAEWQAKQMGREVPTLYQPGLPKQEVIEHGKYQATFTERTS